MYVSEDRERVRANVGLGQLEARLSLRIQELNEWSNFARQQRHFLYPVAKSMVFPKYKTYSELTQSLVEAFWAERFQLPEALSIYGWANDVVDIAKCLGEPEMNAIMLTTVV